MYAWKRQTWKLSVIKIKANILTTKMRNGGDDPIKDTIHKYMEMQPCIDILNK
jgi:hypothetical protein